ncbi:hypothetical protein [Microcoleus sp. S13_C5]|uniref:hypothetical protein n=1 Tax=Microcoleus sp. S13_C5 TaxID=3055411 RepID=UPI002FD525BB
MSFFYIKCKQSVKFYTKLDALTLGERLTEQSNIDRAMQLVKEHNPTLSPAINRTWIDSPGRTEVIAIYRIQPWEMSGRTTDGISSG